MAKSKSSGRSATASRPDFKEQIAKLDTRLHQVRELMQDGVPYLDALKVKVELGIKETIREVFGQSSQEFQVLRKHTIDITSSETIGKTAAIIQGLITYFEYQHQVQKGLASPVNKTPLEFAKDFQQGVNPVAPPSSPPPQPAAPAAPPPSPPTPQAAPKPAPPPVAAAAPQRPDTMKPVPPTPATSPPTSSTRNENPPDVAAPHTPTRTGTGPNLSSTDKRLDEARTPKSLPSQQGTNPMPNPALVSQSAGRSVENPGTTGGSLELIRKICNRFHTIIRQLRERSEDRTPFEIEDEHDVRDMLRALLHLEFDDVGIEEWTTDVLKNYVQRDFLVQPGNMVVLVAKTRAGLGTKELTDLWTAACQRYKTHSQCQCLVGFIYDPEGRIANPRKLEETLATHGEAGTIDIQIFPK